MKKIIVLFAMLALFCVVSSCKKEPKAEAKPLNIGEWQLSSITAKNVAFAGQTIDVDVAFAEDGGFELYQMIGQGRYRKFTGTWTLNDDTLSGSYASGKPWGSSYTLSGDTDKITLISTVSGEADVYVRGTIPDSVKNDAYEE